MANHVIQQVRDDILARITNLTTTGARAYLYKDRPQDPSKVPFLYLQTGADSPDQSSGSLGFPQLEDLLIDFEVTIVCFQTGDYEAQALTIRKEIETALLGTVDAKTLSGKVLWLKRTNCQPDQDDTGGKPCYALRLTITGRLRHLETQPDSFTY